VGRKGGKEGESAVVRRKKRKRKEKESRERKETTKREEEREREREGEREREIIDKEARRDLPRPGKRGRKSFAFVHSELDARMANRLGSFTREQLSTIREKERESASYNPSSGSIDTS